MLMIDIVPDLLEKIERDFNQSVNSNENIKKLQLLVESNGASYVEANQYALEVGQTLADVFSRYISSSTLPDGRMYFNIGERILTPTLSNNYNLVTDFTAAVQNEMNRKAGIGLKTRLPSLNKDKIKGIIDRLSSEMNFDDVAWILSEPVINFTHQAVNDVLESNAEFQANLGLSPKIKRTLVGGACDWCVRLAGIYSYPSVPDDIYKRHERCRCTVEYIPDGVKKQNVWTKAWD